MKQNTNPFLIIISSFIMLVSLSSDAACEFYEYQNKNGVKCYTDDPGMIPDQKRINARVHTEKYDGMADDEKEEMIKQEEKALKEIKEKQKDQSSKHNTWLRNFEYEERERKRMAERAAAEERSKKWRDEYLRKKNKH